MNNTCSLVNGNESAEKEVKEIRLKTNKHLFIIIRIDVPGSVPNSQFITNFGLVREIILLPIILYVSSSDDECDQV